MKKVILTLFFFCLSISLLPAQNWIKACSDLRTTFEQGNYQKAVMGCEKVVEAAKDAKASAKISDPIYFNVLTLIGHLYNDMGIYHKAEVLLVESLEIIKPHL